MADKAQDPKPQAAKRPIPRSTPSAGSRSGWITLAIVAGTFLLMRFFSPNPEKTNDLSQAQFRTAVETGKVAEVVRVREVESGSTYLRGKLQDGKTTFRVRLVPGENEKLMDYLTEQGVSCPVEEKEPLIGPLMQQML